ncbi:MAG: 50S ribosomal protein L25 [Deltaproteobacteria bacterium]|nr:50S ribosomal protein L25 [Deltaproteobacteria bacterium]
MQQKQMNIELRTKTGTGVSRRLRMADMVPGVVYGKGLDPVTVSVKSRDLQEAISGAGGQNNLITFIGGGSLDQNIAIVADIQRDPIKRTFKHVDLHRINPNEKLRVTVPVVISGSAIGVKEGGLLDQAHHELHIECLPGNIPDSITIDVTDLKVGESVHVSEITLPEGIVILDQPKIPVVSILGKAKEEEETAAESPTAA